MVMKTENELLKEIEQKNEEIEVLKADIKKLEKYRNYDTGIMMKWQRELRLSMTALLEAVSQNSKHLK